MNPIQTIFKMPIFIFNFTNIESHVFMKFFGLLITAALIVIENYVFSFIFIKSIKLLKNFSILATHYNVKTSLT